MEVFGFEFSRSTRMTELNNLEKQHVFCWMRFFFPSFYENKELRSVSLGGGLGKGFIFHIIEERT